MASYVGLLTGAGAAEGLETLLARLRAEQELRQRAAEQAARAAAAAEQAALERQGLALRQREIDLLAPVRAAEAARAQAETKRAQLESEAQERLLRMVPLPGAQLTAGQPPVGPPGAGTAGSGPVTAPSAGGLDFLNTTAGRLLLSLNRIPPSAVLPRPENPSDWEGVLAAYAKKLGKPVQDLTFDEVLQARERFEAAGRGPTPPAMTTFTQGGTTVLALVDRPGGTVRYVTPPPVPASAATGPQPGKPASWQQRMEDERRRTRTYLARLADLSAQLNTDEGVRQIIKGGAARAEALVNVNPLAREFQQIREPLALSLATALNGGRPSDKDLEAASSLLPRLSDPATVARHKLQLLYRALEEDLDAVPDPITGRIIRLKGNPGAPVYPEGPEKR